MSAEGNARYEAEIHALTADRDRLAAAVARVRALSERWDSIYTGMTMARDELRAAIAGEDVTL